MSNSRQIVAWIYGCYAWLIFTLILLSCGGLIILLRRPPITRRIARFGTRLMFYLTALPVTASGLENLPAEPHVLLVNHSSFLDGLVLIALLPACPGYAFAVRQEFDIQCLLCPLLRSLGSLVLSRFDRKKPGKSDVDKMTARLRRGQNLLVFPEGGFSQKSGLKPFHTGAFVAAAQANVPIVVAGLRGVRQALRGGTWLPKRVPITLAIGPVLASEELASNGHHVPDPVAIKKLSESARQAMMPLAMEGDAAACDRSA